MSRVWIKVAQVLLVAIGITGLAMGGTRQRAPRVVSNSTPEIVTVNPAPGIQDGPGKRRAKRAQVRVETLLASRTTKKGSGK